MLKKSTLREIRTSLARYLAIFAIVALGVGFFAGLKVCKASMTETARKYMAERNFYHYELMSSYGIDEGSIKTAEADDEVTDAEGSVQLDILAGIDSSDEEVVKCYTLPEKINVPDIVEGRLPEKKDECVLDSLNRESRGIKLGSTVYLQDTNKKDTRDKFKIKEFKVVGFVNSPNYLDYQRGSSSVGDGATDLYMYIRKSALDVDYYTSLYLRTTVKGEDFSQEQEDNLDEEEASMKALAKTITADRRASIQKEAQEKLDEKRGEYQDSLAKYKSEKARAEREMNSAETKLNKGAKTIRETRAKTRKGLAAAEAGMKQLQGALAQVNAGIKAMEEAGAVETPEYQELVGQKSYIEGQIKTTQAGIDKARAGLKTLDKENKKIVKGRKVLAASRKKAQSEFAKAEAKLKEAREKLDDAQEEIDEMETGNSYALSREENPGYSSFKSNSDIINNIARIFPVFFFLVAALVCMTTMTRMIDEQRTQIGVLKALGYSNSAILAKYMFYSGSAAVLGAIAGFFIGCRVFPMVIWKAYTMMYNFSDTCEYVFDGKLLIICLIAAVVCSMGATWSSISSDFGVVPAQLIRPKTLPVGKRILIERITPLWNRISFLYKVSIRNIFRYKKRFVMMILGISGCTALLIAGFGINTTVSKVAQYQYSEISLYDYQLVFDDGISAETQKKFISYNNRRNKDNAGDVKFLNMSNVDVKKGKKTTSVHSIAATSEDFGKFISLHDGSTGIEFPAQGEIVVAKKIQKALDLQVGDKVTVKSGYREMEVTVAAACDNYVGENIYMSIDTYQSGLGKKAKINSAYVKVPSGISKQELRNAASRAGHFEEVAATSVNIDMMDRVAKMMKSLNSVVYVVIMCAGLLAFIVLYNLTNINIMERIREIATIKVLGFNQMEVSAYVFRENLFLTGIAALVGMPMGKWLLEFVIDNIAVSMIYFQPRINTTDYLYSVILTFVFALIVNLAMQKRLRNVSMTESLKSVE